MGDAEPSSLSATEKKNKLNLPQSVKLGRSKPINFLGSATSRETNTDADGNTSFSQPAFLRGFSELYIPQAPLMSSSVPSPMVFDSLPQLSLPPPSVDNVDSGSAAAATLSFSCSLNERMTYLAHPTTGASIRYSQTIAASCPSTLGEQWTAAQDSSNSSSSSSGPLDASEEIDDNVVDDFSTQGPRHSSLTALSILLSKKLGQSKFSGATPVSEAPLTGDVVKAEENVEANGPHNEELEMCLGKTRQDGHGSSSTATTTSLCSSSSRGSSEHGGPDLSPLHEGVSVDAALGPFVLDIEQEEEAP